ncbi:MAG: hypothetical protein ACXWP5_14340, partial [Bdellovibrionota bacterium]
ASGVSDIGVIGTAFKDGCTDRRSSPVIQLLEELAKRQPRRRFHFLAEPVTDAPPLAGAMVHAEASSLLRDVGVLVLGSHPKIAALIPGIESFTGPVVDLMMMPRATYSLRRRSGYHRLC